MNLMKLKNWKKEFYKRLNEDWFVKDGVVSRGVKQFMKDFGNALLDELEMEEEKISKKDWTLQNLLTSVAELKKLTNQTKRQINYKIKSLRKLLK